MSRRTSPIIVCACSVAETRSSSARSMSDSVRLRTASSVNVSPARAGPRPSWGARRTRPPGAPARQRRRACVEAPADAPPLRLAKLHDALPRQLKLLREPHCVDCGGNLRRKVGDQVMVALTQALARSRCEPEFTDGDPLVDERKGE